MAGRAIYIVPKNSRNLLDSPPIVQQRAINNRPIRRLNTLPQRCVTQPRIISSVNPGYSKLHNSFHTNPCNKNTYSECNKQVRLTSNLTKASLRKRNYECNDSDDMNIEEVYSLIGENPYNNHLNAIPRKRERLNNLTAEEKLNRRKMKNRVAAQTARDRKKERSQRLEKAVKNLLSESNCLRVENRNLLIENQRLRRENEELLLNQSNTNKPFNEMSVPLHQCLDSLNTFGSAASINGSLPWKQVFKANQTTRKLTTMSQSKKRHNLFTIICLFLMILSAMIKNRILKLTTKNLKPYSTNSSRKKTFKILTNFVMKSLKKNFYNKIQYLKTMKICQINPLNIQSHQHLSVMKTLLYTQMKRRKSPRKVYIGWGPPLLWKTDT